MPVGYVRSPEGGIALDPDEQVRSVVSLVFAKYVELSSLTKTHAYFVTNNIQIGLRTYKGPGKGRLVWQRPRRSALIRDAATPDLRGGLRFRAVPVRSDAANAGQTEIGSMDRSARGVGLFAQGQGAGVHLVGAV